MTDLPELPPQIQIMIVEDHSVVREGLRLLINKEPDMQVMAEAGSSQEATEVTAEPDVIVADLVLRDSKGLETVKTLRTRFPSSKLVVLTMIGDLQIIRGAIEAGAQGYLLKESAAAELIAALRVVNKGGEYLQPSLGAAIAKNPTAELGNGNQVLTPRETEVLRLIALGHTNAEAAQLLGITAKTVEAHRSHIANKLGVKTRAELVRLALDGGLIERT